MKRMAAYLGAIVIVAVLAVTAFIYSGVYDVSATEQHSRPVFWVLQTVMRRSVQERSPDLPMPDLSDADLLARGLRHYERHCTQCHGAPGIAPADFAMGMQPVAPNLVHTARTWTEGDIFWAIKNGIQMTGMPAWDYRLDDAEIWSLVAIVKRMASISPRDYQDARAEVLGEQQETSQREAEQTDTSREAGPATMEPGDPERGKAAILQYACISCHQIPGIVGPDVRVGPLLEGIAERQFIAGVIPNTPENMVRWISRPQEINPLTAMPDMGVSEAHARDIAAYLDSIASR